MLPSGVYRVDGYRATNRGHWAAALEPLPQDAPLRANRVTGTTLWSALHDEGKEGLHRALTLPANAHLLGLLADQPEGRVEWCLRSPDPAADVDAVAWITDEGADRRTLLLMDCEPVGTTKPSRLRTQYVRSQRKARGLLANLVLGEQPTTTVLVMLAAWRPGMDRPKVEHRPGWRGEEIPRPTVWGYLPFCHDDVEHVLFGRWVHLDANRWARQVEERTRRWRSTDLKTLPPSNRPLRRIDFRLDLGKGSGLVFLLDRGPFRAKLQVPSAKHRRAMLAEGREDYQVRRIRSLRDAAYDSGWAPTGWSFLGETVEEGCPWLVWQWTQADAPHRIDWVTANSEAERFAITMKMFIAGT